MRSILGALLALGVVIGLVGRARAQDTWVGGAPLQGRVVVGGAGEAWVGVWVDAPNVVAPPSARAPMAVSLVIDTSGSMAGDKIQNARMAAQSLIESLADGDVVSVYGFSNAVTEIAPPTVVNAATRGMLIQRAGMIVAGGGTNLWDGMQAGIGRIAQAPATHPVRRVFVISDGRANVGPSDPQSLGDLAARATEWGTQVTAIGVGYDYDPQTLQAMVVRSAGRLHHLGAPHQMAAILEHELQRMQRSVALDGTIEIVPAPGVIILGGATTGAVIEGGRLRFALGALDAGQRREVLFRVRMSAPRAGDQPLANVRLSYRTPDSRDLRTQQTVLRYEATTDTRAVASAPTTPRVAAMVAQHEASEAQRRAADMLARGEAERAQRELAAARVQLDRTVTTYHFDDAQIEGDLRRRSASVGRDADAAGAARTESEQRARSYELQAAPMAAEGY
ncbi:vWA domain-containing protein [Sandaracinus amylolyticus]|uniref:vWA domain-containing protein n=1 Tax=Sandaracinus amylolyticus TaxID=927083 RepID=UPI00069EA6C6|nr:VWA domain-containing protein [Sandaracinus amylolyticus]